MKLYNIVSLTIFILLILTSCNRNDACKEVDCGTKGNCNPTDGHCLCNVGYEISATTGKCVKIDFCENVSCGNHGHCNETNGECVCDSGYIFSPLLGECVLIPCYNVSCGPNASCNPANASCVCNPGYELGNDGNCSLEMRAKFIGTWQGYDCSTLAPHNIIISASNESVTKLIIKNYSNSYCNANNSDLIVKGSLSISGLEINSFTTECPSSSASISNSGNIITLNADKKSLSCSYNVVIQGITYTCSLNYTKI